MERVRRVCVCSNKFGDEVSNASSRRPSDIPSSPTTGAARAPAYRLRDLLRLGNNLNLFQNLKQHLYHISEKHLSVDVALRLQTKEWAAMEAELLSTLPDLFDCNDCNNNAETLKLALQLISANHYRRRFAFKHQIESTARFPRKRNLVMSVTLPTRAASKQQFARSPRKPRCVVSVSVPTRTRVASEREREAVKNEKENNIIDLTLDGGENNVELVELKTPLMKDISNQLPGPVAIKRASHCTSPGPSALRSSAALINSQSTPLHAKSSSQALSSTNTSFIQDKHEDAFELTGVTRVARFLNACSPPMSHFLKPLIDFGCTSEEYLVTVSTWPFDKISQFLSRVVRHGSGGREVTQMDILILQNHFISYFNKAQT